jgi:acetyl esterase
MMGFDPEVRAYLDSPAVRDAPPKSARTPVEVRRENEESAPGNFGPVEPVASVEDREVAGVPVRLYDPSPGAASPVLVYLHGGGWVIGSRNTHDGVCRALANRASCRVASVEYRLAPEHPFPAGLEDAWAVTQAAAEGALGGGVPPAVAVGGDSSGGNLSAVVALRARDAGVPLALQVLIYPVVDCDLDTESYRRCATGNGMTADDMEWYWRLYMGDADRAQPDASPLRAPSLAGVAPAHIVACEHDVLHDEGVAYARRLEREGVPVTLRDERGLIHGYIRLPMVISRARGLWDDCAGALRVAFGA